MDSSLSGAWILNVKFIRTHDVLDFKASALWIVGTSRGPEASDLQKHFSSAKRDEVLVHSDLVIVPDIIGDCRVDMDLEAGAFLNPSLGEGVQMEGGGLLPAAARALPRVHGAAEPCLTCELTCFIEPVISVLKKLTAQFRNPEIENWKDEKLIPKYVAAISLAVDSTGWDSGVFFDRIDGVGLEDVKKVKAENELFARIPRQIHAGPLPQVGPFYSMAAQNIRECRCATHGEFRSFSGIADRVISGMK